MSHTCIHIYMCSDLPRIWSHLKYTLSILDASCGTMYIVRVLFINLSIFHLWRALMCLDYGVLTNNFTSTVSIFFVKVATSFFRKGPLSSCFVMLCNQCERTTPRVHVGEYSQHLPKGEGVWTGGRKDGNVDHCAKRNILKF